MPAPVITMAFSGLPQIFRAFSARSSPTNEASWLYA